MTATTLLLVLVAILAVSTGINRLLHPTPERSKATNASEFGLGIGAGLGLTLIVFGAIALLLFMSLGERERGKSFGCFLLPALSCTAMLFSYAWLSNRNTPFVRGFNVGVAIVALPTLGEGVYVCFAG